MTPFHYRKIVQSLADQLLKRIHNSAMGFECTGAHEAGAVALVKHREKQNHQSKLSPKLLLAVYSQVVSRSTQSQRSLRLVLMCYERYRSTQLFNTLEPTRSTRRI